MSSLNCANADDISVRWPLPVAKRVFSNVESVLGPPGKLSINFTHVLLVALMLVFTMEMANTREASRRRK